MGVCYLMRKKCDKEDMKMNTTRRATYPIIKLRESSKCVNQVSNINNA